VTRDRVTVTQVVIITNATEGWVQHSAGLCMPAVKQLLLDKARATRRSVSVPSSPPGLRCASTRASPRLRRRALAPAALQPAAHFGSRWARRSHRTF
jgi:hypothetical protein